jgi:uncharacterized protein
MSAEPVACNAQTSGPLRRSYSSGGLGKAARPFAYPDPLYGEVRVAGWAAALLATPPFQRLAGVSLSDVPGELLFGRPFPSRLDHAIGVYGLARLARPRDRALQAAALAHDLGHGPFSHLTEPLMIERCGEDHEIRSARLLSDVREALPATAARQLAWLDWDDVARLVLGGGEDGRGALLNGRLDYDNADNVARFLLASELGIPTYDPRALARALRPLSPTLALERAPDDHVYIQLSAEAEALAWQRDRATVYTYLHTGHHNLAAHAMLRKAIDLAAATNILPPDFLDCTDAQALTILSRALDRGLIALVQRVRAGKEHVHRCVWEAEVPLESQAIPATLARWRERLALEARLAGEAALAPHEVIVETIVSNAGRTLPPISSGNSPATLARQPELAPAPRVLHLFAARDAGRDYVRRLRMAAERHLVAMGAFHTSDGEEYHD